MYTIIVFATASHRDSEKVYAIGPFDSMDAAHAYAEKHLDYWHVVKVRQP